MVSQVTCRMVWVFLSILQTCSWSSPQCWNANYFLLQVVAHEMMVQCWLTMSWHSLQCRSKREIGHRRRQSGVVELAMQLGGLMVSTCCMLSILCWPTKRLLCCHCLPPLGDNVRNLHIMQVRDPLKKTWCCLSLGCWQSSLHLLQCQLEGVEVCLLAGANVFCNINLYSFIYTVHIPSVAFHTPNKLNDFDGITYSLYSPQKL